MQSVYEELRDMLLDDLRAALPVDGVLLHLHGAMISERCDDCEGDILERVRQIVGPKVVVGVEYDLHCHLTEQMRANADITIIYKEYPHTDIAERGEELYDLVMRAVRHEIRPVTALHDCRMVYMWRTPVEPMRGFVDRMQALEGKDGILSVSFGHGFPWADMAEVGAKFIVVADGDMPKAQALAAKLAREIWELRDKCGTPHDTIDGAIDFALAAPAGPIVLAEVADNAGGGAPSDSTLVLRRLVERGVQFGRHRLLLGSDRRKLLRRAGRGCAFRAPYRWQRRESLGRADRSVGDGAQGGRGALANRPERRARCVRPQCLGAHGWRHRYRAEHAPLSDILPRRVHQPRLHAG